MQNVGTYDGATLVKASGMRIVVVNLNYRVGPYGFLVSKEVAQGGSLNNGLKDQRFALRWIKRHINKFGGDPMHVVLGGSSAGAASVTLQLAAYGGKDEVSSMPLLPNPSRLPRYVRLKSLNISTVSLSIVPTAQPATQCPKTLLHASAP